MECPYQCETSGKETMKRCTQCRCVAYCDSECQKSDWKQHKKVCFPSVRGFEEPFGPLDQENDGDYYDRAIHAVWGYDTGTREPDWQQFLKSMSDWDSVTMEIKGEHPPKFTYRPGNPD